MIAPNAQIKWHKMDADSLDVFLEYLHLAEIDAGTIPGLWRRIEEGPTNFYYLLGDDSGSTSSDAPATDLVSVRAGVWDQCSDWSDEDDEIFWDIRAGHLIVASGTWTVEGIKNDV